MDDYLVPLVGAVVLIAATYYYLVVMNKPKKLAPILIPPSKRGAAAAVKRRAVKKNLEEVFDGPNMTILYYSQTGTAEDFAQRLANDGKQYGLHTKVVNVEDYDTDNFTGAKHSLIVFCVATYGEGEPPENALQFHEWLIEEGREKDLLNGSKFAIFGLGDRTYDFFNRMGKVVDARLQELGGERIHERGEGDANSNMEEDFLKWKRGFWISARRALNLGEKKAVKLERKCNMKVYSVDELPVGTDINHTARWRHPAEGARVPSHYDIRNTYLANIVVNRELHSPSSDRSCRHIEIQLKDGMHYDAGDHLAVFPLNSLKESEALLQRLGVASDQIIAMFSNDDLQTPLVGPCTVLTAIRSYYDILSPPRKPMLTMLADYTTNEEEKKKLLTLASDDPEDQESYNTYILNDERTVLEVLKELPSINPPLDHFLEFLPRLQPRYYSISSSPSAHPGRVHVTAALVEYITSTSRHHHGVATSWFTAPEQIPAPDALTTGVYPVVPIFIRKSTFHLPPLTTPIIMVGPGTGIAPFRGFLHERVFQCAKHKPETAPVNILFFGCRHPEHDYIYQDELTSMKDSRSVELHVAFSRHTEKKVYVQHLMAEETNASRIFELIESGGFIYVCGDAKHMAKDVNLALRHIIATKKGITESAAEAFVESLRTKNRYNCDVW